MSENLGKSPCCNKSLDIYGVIDRVQFLYCTCCEYEYMLNVKSGKLVQLVDIGDNKFKRHLQLFNQFQKLLTDH